MRYLTLFLLLFITGCDHNLSYEPVDWNSTAPPIPEKLPDPVPPTQISGTNQILLKLHNQQRELKGRPGLQLDSYLCDYAQNHANWMAQRNNLKHSDISVLMGKYMAAGENIAWNQRSEEEVVIGWMNSSGHRDNILNRTYTKVGFGVAHNSKGEPYWCTVFGN